MIATIDMLDNTLVVRRLKHQGVKYFFFDFKQLIII
jgi:hypothetical protein